MHRDIIRPSCQITNTVWILNFRVVLNFSTNIKSKKRRATNDEFSHEENLDQPQTSRTVSLRNNGPLFIDFGRAKRRRKRQRGWAEEHPAASTRSRWWPLADGKDVRFSTYVNRSFRAVLAANRIPSEESELLPGSVPNRKSRSRREGGTFREKRSRTLATTDRLTIARQFNN